MKDVMFVCNYLNSEEKFDMMLNRFISYRKMDVDKFVSEGVLHYSKSFDFMCSYFELAIVEVNNELFTVNCLDDDRWLEPLLIQVDEEGYLVDEFFKEFIDMYGKPLDKYFINYSDYSALMEEIRLNM